MTKARFCCEKTLDDGVDGGIGLQAAGLDSDLFEQCIQMSR